VRPWETLRNVITCATSSFRSKRPTPSVDTRLEDNHCASHRLSLCSCSNIHFQSVILSISPPPQHSHGITRSADSAQVVRVTLCPLYSIYLVLYILSSRSIVAITCCYNSRQRAANYKSQFRSVLAPHRTFRCAPWLRPAMLLLLSSGSAMLHPCAVAPLRNTRL
jgi:hypothetical protein